MMAAQEIATRFDERKMPWIWMTIVKFVGDPVEECAKHIEDNFDAPDIAASLREHVGR